MNDTKQKLVPIEFDIDAIVMDRSRRIPNIWRIQTEETIDRLVGRLIDQITHL
jgi:hypothetical protein